VEFGLGVQLGFFTSMGKHGRQVIEKMSVSKGYASRGEEEDSIAEGFGDGFGGGASGGAWLGRFGVIIRGMLALGESLVNSSHFCRVLACESGKCELLEQQGCVGKKFPDKKKLGAVKLAWI
jgi:hypothetical protein